VASVGISLRRPFLLFAFVDDGLLCSILCSAYEFFFISTVLKSFPSFFLCSKFFFDNCLCLFSFGGGFYDFLCARSFLRIASYIVYFLLVIPSEGRINKKNSMALSPQSNYTE
jgi:hypothetical protein